MKTLNEYRRRRAELEKRLAELQPRIDSGEITAEESAESNTVITELESVNDQIKNTEALEARMKKLTPTASVTVKDNAEDRPFNGMGEYLSAVVRAEEKGATLDPRLRKFASGSNEGVGSEGAFLVQTDYAGELVKDAYGSSVLAQACRQVPISSGANGTTWWGVDETSRANGSRYGGVRGYWASEAATVTAATPKFTKIELKLKKLMALAYATDEVLADASQLEAFIKTAVPAELAFLLDDAIVRGTGAGQPLGILNSAALVSQAAEGAQTADTINAANVTKMYSRLPASSIQKAVFYINQESLPQIWVLNTIATGAGQPMFMPPGGLTQAPFGTLLGRPVRPIEQCSAIGDVGDILLADMSQYLLATKGGVQQAVSMHVRFIYDEMCFRFTLRVDGRPAWDSALTPYKGTPTVSPFVAVAAR